ncbi:GntR family transcriptional regulator [Enemella sp. A6]|uniref:GntR family transcriptional regulator n=1 Tax=Enemella sp. A6 TaxID=3440152 RepID=UPI003EB82369
MDPAAITPPRRATTSDQAYEAILDAILQGRLLPNEPLRLKNLAESLEMSMMPVREAVRRLEALGVIEVEPYRGARVREVSAADLTDTYRTRILLEGYLARRAAVRFTPEVHAEALAQLDLQAERQQNHDPDAARAAHRGFHFTIYQAAEAPWAVRSVEPTWANSERYRVAAGMNPTAVAMRRTEHDALLSACASGDPDAAERALREHLVRTVANLNPGAADQLAAEFNISL